MDPRRCGRRNRRVRGRLGFGHLVLPAPVRMRRPDVFAVQRQRVWPARLRHCGPGMSCEGIEFREGTATVADIQTHLAGCDGNFSPRLSLKVDIGEYSRKIIAKAQTFEAWFGDALVGLVAVYL